MSFLFIVAERLDSQGSYTFSVLVRAEFRGQCAESCVLLFREKGLSVEP